MRENLFDGVLANFYLWLTLYVRPDTSRYCRDISHPIVFNRPFCITAETLMVLNNAAIDSSHNIVIIRNTVNRKRIGLGYQRAAAARTVADA